MDLTELWKDEPFFYYCSNCGFEEHYTESYGDKIECPFCKENTFKLEDLRDYPEDNSW